MRTRRNLLPPLQRAEPLLSLRLACLRMREALSSFAADDWVGVPLRHAAGAKALFLAPPREGRHRFEDRGAFCRLESAFFCWPAGDRSLRYRGQVALAARPPFGSFCVLRAAAPFFTGRKRQTLTGKSVL